jgi:hypothetical protein
MSKQRGQERWLCGRFDYIGIVAAEAQNSPRQEREAQLEEMSRVAQQETTQFSR